MPREGAIIFRDLVGKLGGLRIERDNQSENEVSLISVAVIRARAQPGAALGIVPQCKTQQLVHRTTSKSGAPGGAEEIVKAGISRRWH